MFGFFKKKNKLPEEIPEEKPIEAQVPEVENKPKVNVEGFENNDHGYGRAGASRTKASMSKFFTRQGGPDKDIGENIETLRERSRDSYMSIPIASGVIKKYRTSVVGKGLVPKPNLRADILGITKEQAVEIEQNIKVAFNAWAKSQNADAMRMHNFYVLQGLVMLSWVMNGDVFAIPRRKNREGVKNRLCVQVIEADRIRNPYGLIRSASLDVREGVELDSEGELIAYHVSNSHPGDKFSTKSVRVKAYNKFGKRNILHIFEPERPDQRRGVPILAPIMESIKQIGRYSQAELMAAVINGMQAMFVEQTKEQESNLGSFGSVGKQNPEEPNKVELVNGIVNFLKPGQTVKDTTPGRPNANYKLFIDAVYEEMGTGVEMPKEVMMSHFESSYSASRAALEEAWKRFYSVREILVNYFCQPVYEEFLLEEMAVGRLKLPGYFDSELKRREYARATWVGSNKVSLDPFKEMKANEVALALNLTNREIITQGMGLDFDEIIIQKLREEALLKKGGVNEEE